MNVYKLIKAYENVIFTSYMLFLNRRVNMYKCDYEYVADKGKHFILQNLPSEKEHTVISTYSKGYVFGDRVMCYYVDNGYVVEEDIPGWTKLKGYEVVYYRNGNRLFAGDSSILPTFEIAQKLKKNYDACSWFNHEIFIEEISYEGVPLGKSEIYNGKKVINQEHYFGLAACEIGDYFSEDVIDEFINALPPTCMKSDCVQLGEPALGRKDKNGKYRTTYETFKRISDGIWEYCGSCFKGGNISY